jgi:surface protein
MNQDIVYEILKFLHLCPEENGGPLLFKRVIFSKKSFQGLEFKNFEKPIVLIIKGKEAKFRSILNRGSTIYWGDGSVEFITNKFVNEEPDSEPQLESDSEPELESDSEPELESDSEPELESEYGYEIKFKSDQFFSDTEDDNILWEDERMVYNLDFSPYHLYSEEKFHIIKIFDNIMYTMLPKNTTDLVSIGKMKCLNNLFVACNEMDAEIGKKWDTSHVVSVHRMFDSCINLNKNIGRNWNTSRITNMSGMFENCNKLNKNVGKNWDTFRVRSMSRMFINCKNLNQKIGKRWDVSNVEEMNDIF